VYIWYCKVVQDLSFTDRSDKVPRFSFVYKLRFNGTCGGTENPRKESREKKKQKIK